MQKIRRGEIWDVDLNPTRGAEIRKIRPCVVINADGLGKLPLRIIVPITGWLDAFGDCYWFVRLEPDTANGLDKLSGADAFQIKSVSTTRFARRRGVISDQQMADIIAAVELVVQAF